MFWYVSGYNLSRGMKKYEDTVRKTKKYTFKTGDGIRLSLDKDSGYIILSGEVRCDFHTKTARSIGLISLLAGECFGGLSIPAAANVSLTAVKDTIVIEPAPEEFMAMAKSSDPVQLTFYKNIFRKKVVITMRPETLVFKPSKFRLEEALRILAGSIGEHRKSSISIRVRPTSERLARMVGLGRFHTILTVAELYNEHKVIPAVRTLSLPI